MTLKKQTGIRIIGICAVAKRLGCSHTHLHRIINGERRMTDAMYRRARALGIRLPYVKN